VNVVTWNPADIGREPGYTHKPVTSTSLWIANGDGRASSTRTAGFGLEYLLKTADHELRMWRDTEFIPKLVFVGVESEVRSRRDGRARQLREQRRTPKAA
jgi:hypothetical protein